MPLQENIYSKEKKTTASHLRQVQHLCQNFSTEQVKVVPGKDWAIHYPQGEENRKELLQGVLEGKYTKTEVQNDLQPDGIIFPSEGLAIEGFKSIESKLRDITSRIQYSDPGQLLDVLEQSQNKDVAIDDVVSFYDSIVQNRTRQKLIDSYGHTGKEQIKNVLEQEYKTAETGSSSKEKIIQQLKNEWIEETLNAQKTKEIALSEEERNVLEILRPAFEQYVKKGDYEGYDTLFDFFQKDLKIKEIPSQTKETETPQLSEEEKEELQEELEPFMPDPEAPNQEEDLTIPPEEKDTYEVPPLQEDSEEENNKEQESPETEADSTESKEKTLQTVFFEITANGTSTAVKIGKYANVRKSYYNPSTLEWSTQKKVSEYKETVEGYERQTIRGRLELKLHAFPIPVNHALDLQSLTYTSEQQPLIFRDQNGCFYIQGTGQGEFSIDFLREDIPFQSSTVPEDLQEIFQRGTLLEETESLLKSLSGTNTEKALSIQQYIRKNKFYPGSGSDLKKAGALQAKLKHTSTGENYIQNLDRSKFLECYSAQNLFIALCRSVSIPTRLVTGHVIDSAKGGKAKITDATGHAWSEIWDGTQWKTIDATPSQTEEKEDESRKEKPNNTTTEQANTDELDSQQAPEEESPSEKDNDSDDKTNSSESSSSSEVSEASDSDFSEAQENQQQMEQTLQENMQQQKQMQDQMTQAKSAEELQEIKDELEANDELLDDLKEELEEKLEAQEEALKDEVKDMLEKMNEDGFLSEEKLEELKEQLEDGTNLDELSQFEQQIQRENKLYEEYEKIREEVMPLIEDWYQYFVECLPREKEFTYDEDTESRRGKFDPRAANKFRNWVFGTVNNPRIIEQNLEPKFISSIVLDISGSMSGQKIKDAQKLLIFYNELFSMITKKFGYIRFSIHLFNGGITEVKDFDQDYDSPEQYTFPDGLTSTIKYRLMDTVKAGGGNDDFSAIKRASERLETEKEDFPDYASAMYFIGDGGIPDSEAEKINEFMEQDFGEHLKFGVLLGSDEKERQQLVKMFGEENTEMSPDFDDLVGKNMLRFSEDVTEYIEDL